MTGYINSDQFRRHPTGGKGLLYILRILFLVGSVIGLGMIIASLVAMFDNEISLYVVAKRAGLADVSGDGFTLTSAKQVGMLNFKIRNAFEWLLIPRSNKLDLYGNIFSTLITWQLFMLAKETNIDNPFYNEVLKRLRNLQQLIIIGWVITSIRYSYVIFVVKDVTGGSFQLNSLSYLITPGYLSLGTWLIVLLFSRVYKKGVFLQKEQDLTI